jgi:flagella basal body P-ring formation protein FlgA
MPRPLCTWRRLHGLAGLFALLLAAALPAAESDPLAVAAHDFLIRQAAGPDRQVSVAVAPVAANLPPCADPQAFLPQPTQRLLGRVAVGIRCADGTTRYRQASVTVSAAYPVARQALAAGEVVTAEMLELQQGDLGRLPRHALLDAEQAIGRELTRPLSKGSPLPANALRSVPLVVRGARVRVEARAGGFVASREGTALDNGGLGDEIRIRTETGAVLRARVHNRNLLTVDF